MLINGIEKVEIENLKNPKAFIDYLQTTDDIYEKMGDYNPTKKRRLLIILDDMISDMESNRLISSVFKGKKTEFFACFYLAIFISKYQKSLF